MENKALEIVYMNSLPSLMAKNEIDLETYVYRRKIVEDRYKETGDWSKVITSVVFYDEPTTQEVFIDIVENLYNTKLIDYRHLLDLTRISVPWSEEMMNRFLQLCIYTNRENKLYDAILHSLILEAKYTDILQYKAADFGLPESWENWLGYESNEEDILKMAIYHAFDLFDENYSPEQIKDLSAKFDAPYSLVADVANNYSDYLDAKVKIERYKELKFMGYSVYDSFNKEDESDKRKWN